MSKGNTTRYIHHSKTKFDYRPTLIHSDPICTAQRP